ncbi:TIGR04104 family putative zinc finger protein [Evansella sp. AB-rgal1]|uniref:TIGR04104 family putative zinc finger protein n=1 Tax=Evansella sp. AB-rgal1 TaxID=3242696 RepID=UPI00359E566A
MILPHCSMCNYQFKWKELLFMMGMKRCPKCGETQYVTAKKRRQAAWCGPVIVTLMFVLQTLFSLTMQSLVVVGLVLIIVGVTVSPFMYEFTEKEEPLF